MKNGRVYLLTLSCLLLTLIKGATLQDDVEDVDDTACPKLTPQAMRVDCKDRGRKVPCTEAKIGTRAQAVFKATVMKNGKVPASEMACQPGGTWKMVAKKTLPRGYEPVPGVGAYKYYDSDSLGISSWVGASKTCHEDGAHLVNIRSAKEFTTIKTLAEAQDKDDKDPSIYIGAHCKFEKGVYRSLLGDPFPGELTSWVPTEAPPSPGDDCVYLLPGDYKANKVNCDYKGNNINFICEYPME